MRVTALDVRRRLGKILDRLDRDQQPVIVEQDGRPRAVLLPLELYQERFSDLQEREPRIELVRELRDAARPAIRSTVAELRRLRYGEANADDA